MLLDFFINIIFPSRCLHCGINTEQGKPICEACFKKISVNRTLFCGKCGSRLPNQKKICHKDFPYTLGAAGSYGNEVVKNLIHGLKFKFIRSAAAPLGEILTAYARAIDIPLEKFVVMPIPLSKERLRSRGFNQSELIAKVFADNFKLPMDPSSLARLKHAKAQSETKGIFERMQNVRGNFFVRNPEKINGKNIILVDDVITSGATMLEAATTLKNSGAKKILALAAARA